MIPPEYRDPNSWDALDSGPEPAAGWRMVYRAGCRLERMIAWDSIRRREAPGDAPGAKGRIRRPPVLKKDLLAREVRVSATACGWTSGGSGTGLSDGCREGGGGRHSSGKMYLKRRKAGLGCRRNHPVRRMISLSPFSIFCCLAPCPHILCLTHLHSPCLFWLTYKFHLSVLVNSRLNPPPPLSLPIPR